jgi:hypothetical protein
MPLTTPSNPTPLSRSEHISLPHQHIPVQVLLATRHNTRQMQRELQLTEQALEDMRDTRLSTQRKPIDIRPANQNHLRAQRQRLSNIGSTPNPRIKQNLQLIAHSIHDLRQHSQRANATINLPSTVVANDNPLDANFHGLLGVRDGLDALEDDGAVPVLLQERHIFPRVAGAGEDGAGPFGVCFCQILLAFDAVLCFELGAEDGVREPDCGADVVGAEEGVVAVW